MSGFSPEWLALREPVDHRSRNADLAAQLSARFANRHTIDVVDLGCGTGSNLRGTFHLLPDNQEWTLVDYDERLLSAARERIAAWADRYEDRGDSLIVSKSGKRLTIGFRQADLNADLEGGLGRSSDLITASAFFDLCSVAFIETFASAVARRKATFYTVLTFDGQQQWMPPHPADERMLAAFCAHQLGDKGFGPSAGPNAPGVLSDAFRALGYEVRDGESPWVMGDGDRRLISELATGFAGAVAETGAVDTPIVASWTAEARTGATVGHVDTLAIPGNA